MNSEQCLSHSCWLIVKCALFTFVNDCQPGLLINILSLAIDQLVNANLYPLAWILNGHHQQLSFTRISCPLLLPLLLPLLPPQNNNYHPQLWLSFRVMSIMVSPGHSFSSRPSELVSAVQGSVGFQHLSCRIARVKG